MSSRDRLITSGRVRGEKLRRQIGQTLVDARGGRGLTIAEVAHACGASRQEYRGWELAYGAPIRIDEAALACRVLGLDLVLTTYPAGTGLRDAGHARVIGRFVAELPACVGRSLEVTIPSAGDLRAWDLLLTVGGCRIGVAAETVFRDGQALLRRERQKARDSGVDRLLLVLAATHRNRRAVEEAGRWVTEAFPVGPRAAWAALRACRDVGGDALLFV